jgi:hypothetical protein
LRKLDGEEIWVGSKMMASKQIEACTRCRAMVKGGTSGCHAVLNELLAVHYTDPAYAAVSLLLVDAHALQHPEDHGLKTTHFIWLTYAGFSNLAEVRHLGKPNAGFNKPSTEYLKT